MIYEDKGKRFLEVLNAPGMWSTAWLIVSAWAMRPEFVAP